MTSHGPLDRAQACLRIASCHLPLNDAHALSLLAFLGTEAIAQGLGVNEMTSTEADEERVAKACQRNGDNGEERGVFEVHRAGKHNRGGVG